MFNIIGRVNDLNYTERMEYEKTISDFSIEKYQKNTITDFSIYGLPPLI